MGFFKKLAEAAHSVDIDSIANKMDEAINTATSKLDDAINSLDKKLDGNNGSVANDVRPSYSADDAFVVPEGVTEIDEETFEDYNGESVIVLPSTLEEIEEGSFEQCDKVKYIDLSKVTRLIAIPDNLFSSLEKITEITIPEGVVEIGECVFSNCVRLKKVILPSTLERIDEGTFTECDNIEIIDFSKVTKLTVIPDNLFSGLKKITEITIPEGVTVIGDCVFDNCDQLRKVVLPSTLESIEGGFSECENLQEIVFSEGIKIKSLPDYFLPEDYEKKSFVIPYGVKTVGSPICSQGNIKELYVPATVKEIGAITNNSFNEIDVYLYAYDIEDIEDLCTDAETLYVMPEAYDHYKELINQEDIDDDFELKVMPSEKISFYNESQPIVHQQPVMQKTQSVIPQMPKEAVPPMPDPTVEAPLVVKRPGQLFSDGLEELINAAVASGEITDKKREIILRRAIKEGEDPDEVEMIMDARLYEANNK